MLCPTCHKRLPVSVHFCAYCGAALERRPWRAWLAAVSLPAAARPAALVGVIGGLSGAFFGGLAGQLLGDTLLGGLVGAAGVGIAAAWGDALAAPYLDRDSARRFGQLFGGVGGGLAVLGGLLAAVIIALRAGSPEGVEATLSLFFSSLALGFPGALTGGFLGAAVGVLAGRFAARFGYLALQRRGAVIGAAMAWTLGGVIGGVYAGDFAARLASTNQADGALLGMLIQVALGALVLTQFQRLVQAYRAWRRRPHP